MKKLLVILILTTCAVLLVIIVTKINCFGEKKILGNENDIDKITLILNSTQEKRTKEFSDEQSIMRLFDIIQKTHDVSINRYLGHEDSMQADSKFDIVIIFKNGTTEFIRACENPIHIYKFLDTKGSSGDLGYITGTNEDLWSFVEDNMK